LEQLVLPPVAPVRETVGEMLRTIQLHDHASVRTQEVDLQASCAIERDGQLRVHSEPPLCSQKRLEAPEEKCLRRTPRALGTRADAQKLRNLEIVWRRRSGLLS